ncbi:MAG: hypothetical protein V2I51_19085 [Anderseniella sp.]|nr:hypothetical protein [Anderseniella sp.]
MAGLSDSVRQQVFARAGHRCEYCVQASSEDTYRLASPRLTPPAAYDHQNEVKH